MQNSIRNLSDLTKAEIEALSQAQKQKPTLVIVHPYYQFSKNPGLDDLLTGPKHKGRLIIFLEEEARIDILKERLEKLSAANNHTILIAPTLRYNPQPVIGWQKFFKLIDALKIKRIVVGGKDIQKTTLEEIIRRTPLTIDVHRRFAKEYKEYIKATRARMHAAKLNGGTGYTFCAGTTWSMLKAREKQKVKIVQNQFTTAKRR